MFLDIKTKSFYPDRATVLDISRIFSVIFADLLYVTETAKGKEEHRETRKDLKSKKEKKKRKKKHRVTQKDIETEILTT